MSKTKVVQSGNKIILKRAILLVAILGFAAYGLFTFVSKLFSGSDTPTVAQPVVAEKVPEPEPVAKIAEPEPEPVAEAPRQKRSSKFQILRSAAISGTVQDIEIFLENGADVNKRHEVNGWTPLMYAARYSESAEVVRALLKAGARVNDRNQDGQTALELVKKNDTGAARAIRDTLIKAGALEQKTEPVAKAPEQTQNPKFSSLWSAAASGTAQDIEIFIKNGAYINEKSSTGWTPLMYAASNSNSTEVIRALLKAGARVNDRTPDGRTALELAEKNTTSAARAILDALIKASALEQKPEPVAQAPEKAKQSSGYGCNLGFMGASVFALLVFGFTNSKEGVY